MNFWDGEDFARRFDEEEFSISDQGPLLGPVLQFHVERDHSLQLILTTRSNAQQPINDHREDPSRIFENESQTSFSSPAGGKGIFFGVTTLSTERIENYQDLTGETVQISHINHIEYLAPQAEEVALTFEWLGNFPAGIIWPTSVTTEDGKRTIAGSPPITFDSPGVNFSGTRNGIRLTVGGYDLHLCSCRSQQTPSGPQRASLMFCGSPDDEERDKIRNCLSFAFGMPLISLGCSKFDAGHKLVGFKARTPSSLDGRAWRLYSLPAAPIYTNGSNILNPQAVSRLANAIFDNYDKYDLRTLLWQYWHAVVAPIYMAPAYYGAIIEAIQRKYLALQSTKINSRIIPKKDYKKLKLALLSAAKSFEMTQDTSKIFTDKLNEGNKVPQKVITQRFFDMLQLEMRDIELIAWSRRNDAAHGNDIPDDDYISLLRETHILKIMFHRTILKLVNGSDHYIDYNAPYFPIRALKDSVDDHPNDR